LDTLITDCAITTANCTSILNARHDSLRRLHLGPKDWSIISELNGISEFLEELEKCSKIEEMADKHYPVFKGLRKLSSLQCLTLGFLPHHDFTLLQETFCPEFLPSLLQIEVATYGCEDQIYPIIAKACPNLKGLALFSFNSNIELHTVKEMVDQCVKLEILSIEMFSGCSFNISDLFDENRFQELKCVDFNFGAYPKSQARKMFENIPNLIFANHNETSYVSQTVTMETILVNKDFCSEKISILEI
jgi:hypothetical protein